jgi:hypothetical protein
VRATTLRKWILLAAILACFVFASRHAGAQSTTDRRQQVQMALDQYAAAKTQDQRATILDFLQHLDRKTVAAAVVDHILAAHSGVEATVYNGLIENLAPESCAALLDRVAGSDSPTEKGKLLVALRHCGGEAAVQALDASLADKRPVLFESHSAHPRRVCDMAYNELYLKLRDDPFYGLDPSTHLRGIITEKMPDKARDDAIAKLKAKLAQKPSPAPPSAAPSPPSPSPIPSASPSATPTPVPMKPASASAMV